MSLPESSLNDRLREILQQLIAELDRQSTALKCLETDWPESPTPVQLELCEHDVATTAAAGSAADDRPSSKPEIKPKMLHFDSGQTLEIREVEGERLTPADSFQQLQCSSTWTEANRVNVYEACIGEKKSVYEGTNAVPRSGTPGRVLHLGLTDGEIANRVIVVGHHTRAELLSQFLQPEDSGSLFKLASDRGFLTYTGKFGGERLSVVSIGMGLAMMDFFLREARAVVAGPMAVVRLGTCGCLQESVKVGNVSVANGSALVQRNYSHFDSSSPAHAQPYTISELCLPDSELNSSVVSALQKAMSSDKVNEGTNITADSFYSSQGRFDPSFNDENDRLISEVLKKYPKAITMEMETFQLFHLARSCLPKGSMRAAAAVVNVANRPTGEVVGEEALRFAESEGGKALMKALAELRL